MPLYEVIQGSVAPIGEAVIIKEEEHAQEGDRAESSEPTPPPPTPPLPPISLPPVSQPTMVWELPPIAPLPDITSCTPCPYATQSIGALEVCGVFATGVIIGFIFCKVLTPSISESCDWGGSDC